MRTLISTLLMTASHHERQTLRLVIVLIIDNKMHSLTISAVFRMNFADIVVMIL